MKPQTSRQLRRLHQYVGLFFTPAILFFALSGALQTVGLHENHDGGPAPAAWIRWMAGVHKDQRVLLPAARPEAEQAPPSDEHNRPAPAAKKHREHGPSPVPLKVFVVLLALSLAVSSLTGATMALTNPLVRRTALIALALGVVVPLALVMV